MDFRDLKRQYAHIKGPIDKAMAEVISSAQFISGEQVCVLESTLAEYTGSKHCISCANGTDAISIALMAYGVGSGDAVFVPDFTFFSSGECPATVGATPVFVDVKPDTYNISPEALEDAVEKIIAEGELKPRAVVAVDLFGTPFEYEVICAICNKYGLILLEDAAQGFGGHITLLDGTVKMACSLGDISTTSFFPAKPFGCYGDGGAIFTNDDSIAALCRSIAVHGKDMGNPSHSNAKYNNARLGMNSRLDTLQAGVLLAKFPVFCEEELSEVNRVAKRYSEQLAHIEGLAIPNVLEGYYSSWAQYTVQLPTTVNRAEVQKQLKEKGIPTNIYYIKPMHKQGAFQGTRSSQADCPVADKLCEKVLCLPIHPYLTDDEINKVCEALKAVLSHTTVFCKPRSGVVMTDDKF